MATGLLKRIVAQFEATKVADLKRAGTLLTQKIVNYKGEL
jgi:hypothetical protein